MESYQNCSGCCVRQLCTMICTQTYEQFLKISVGLGLGLVCVHVFRFSIFIPLFSSMVGIFSLLWHNKILVALFSYTVWPTAVKYGTITGTGAQHVFSHFGELLWPRGAPPQAYMHIALGKKKSLDNDLCKSHLGKNFAAMLCGAVRIGHGSVGQSELGSA